MASQQIFTCISCTIAFTTAEDQRNHYRSDFHRYNMKRRVASLPPISAEVFNQKVLEKKAETAIQSSLLGSHCEVCNKTYTTENAYRSHINSKKHKGSELKAARSPQQIHSDDKPEESNAVSGTTPEATPPVAVEEAPAAPADETDELEQSIDRKIAAARSRLSETSCLFCPAALPSVPDNLIHMSDVHSFFVPDVEYLTDPSGLLNYLGEKVAIGNVCLYCNEKSREFRTLDAVRKHMLDKSHCKIAYESEKDRLEISDYYDFVSSYPARQRRRKNRVPNSDHTDEDGAEWEDIDDDGEADEVVDEERTSEPELEPSQITFGDTPFELVLPSGARIGHRSLQRYYTQSFHSRGEKAEDPNSGAAIVRRLLTDRKTDLVPRKGGFGAYGMGTEVIKARNRGEAKEAGRHIREFRDQRRREEFKTKIGFIHNSQKHFRDPLLQ